MFISKQKRAEIVNFRPLLFLFILGETVKLPLKTSVNGWYIGGNFVFGGLIGWLIVDPLNDGMYTISPKETNPVLALQSEEEMTPATTVMN